MISCIHVGTVFYEYFRFSAFYICWGTFFVPFQMIQTSEETNNKRLNFFRTRHFLMFESTTAPWNRFDHIIYQTIIKTKQNICVVIDLLIKIKYWVKWNLTGVSQPFQSNLDPKASPKKNLYYIYKYYICSRFHLLSKFFNT